MWVYAAYELHFPTMQNIAVYNCTYIYGWMGGSWFHLMSCSWSFIGFDLLSYMVQFLFGSEIIFHITSRFGLAKLQNEGGALKNKIWTDSLSA